jgi:hypothetical protein
MRYFGKHLMAKSFSKCDVAHFKPLRRGGKLENKLGAQGNTMAHLLEQDRTGFFTVVGAPPVAEEHRDTRDHYHLDSVGGTSGMFVAGVWLVLYGAIVVAMVIGKSGVGQAVAAITAFAH